MMQKKVLVIYYSQTGQLEDIIKNLTEPFTENGISVERVTIKPVNDYPFPWTGEKFYDVMPDCVLGIPSALRPFDLKEEKYDLIIFGWQSWFLSPCIPANSLLQIPAFRRILKNTTVITITGARNMWLNAFVRIKKSLNECSANLVGNIALTDKHFNPISYITIFHWLLGGKKTRLWGIFPMPGVSSADIKHTRVFGETILSHLINGEWSGMQEKLVKQRAVAYNYSLMFLESKAGPQYISWAKKVNNSKNRKSFLTIYKYYLHFALFIGAPVLLILDAIFVKPFSAKNIRKKKEYYLNLK